MGRAGVQLFLRKLRLTSGNSGSSIWVRPPDQEVLPTSRGAAPPAPVSSLNNLLMDRISNKLSQRHDFFYPEGRLPLMIFGAFFLPVAVVLYGGSAGAHWPVAVFFGHRRFFVCLCCMLYRAHDDIHYRYFWPILCLSYDRCTHNSLSHGRFLAFNCACFGG